MTDHLLVELADLKDGAFYKELLAKRQQVVDTWTSSSDDRLDLLLKGEKRILDQLINDIETARETEKKRRQSAEQKPMQKVF